MFLTISFLALVGNGIFCAPSAINNLEDPTLTSKCQENAINFGQSDGDSQIAVIPSAYSTDGLTSATLQATCTANAGHIVLMMFTSSSGGEVATLENFLPVVSISLNCSYDTDKWTYSAPAGGQIYTFEVTSFRCLQAIDPTPRCLQSAVTFGQSDGGSEITVVPSDYTSNGLTYTMNATCSADPGYIAFMTFNSVHGGERVPVENDYGSVISIRLKCSYETNEWTYSATVGNHVFTSDVYHVKCLQAPANGGK